MEVRHFLSFLFLLSFVSLNLSCAHPNYEDITTGNLPAPQKNEDICPLRFSRASLCGKIVWKSSLVEKGGATFELTTWDSTTGSSQGPFSDSSEGQWAISIYMPSMGHGSAPLKITSQGAGVYEISKVFFIMPGAWEIRFLLKDSSLQIVDQFFFPVEIQ